MQASGLCVSHTVIIDRQPVLTSLLEATGAGKLLHSSDPVRFMVCLTITNLCALSTCIVALNY